MLGGGGGGPVDSELLVVVVVEWGSPGNTAHGAGCEGAKTIVLNNLPNLLEMFNILGLSGIDPVIGGAGVR